MVHVEKTENALFLFDQCCKILPQKYVCLFRQPILFPTTMSCVVANIRSRVKGTEKGGKDHDPFFAPSVSKGTKVLH